MAPKIVVRNDRIGRSQERVDLATPPFGMQPLRRLRPEVLEPDRILTDLAAGYVGRQIKGNCRPRFACQQLVQVPSEKHCHAPILVSIYPIQPAMQTNRSGPAPGLYVRQSVKTYLFVSRGRGPCTLAR